jgi:hypothetical protein
MRRAPDISRVPAARAPDRAMPNRAVTRELRREQRQEPRRQTWQERVKQRQELSQPSRAGVQPQQPANTTRQAAQERRQQLQQRLRQGNVSPVERRELRNSLREESRQQNADRRLNRLETLQQAGRLNRNQQRDLLRLQAAQQLRDRQQPQDQRLQTQQRQQLQPDQRAQRRGQRVTQQQAQAGRFAAPFLAQQNNRAARRGLRLAARAAWQRGAYARYVPWRSGIYWPYAYTDVFHYTFWPEAYEPGYWAYAYDDFFDGVFFPDGAPYVEYAEGPYEGPYARATTGSAPRRETLGREALGREALGREAPGQLTQAAREVCAEPDKGVTAWPFDRIVAAVRPNAEQKELLARMQQAAEEAAERLRQACPENLPMTPAGRMQAMTMRLQATLDSVKLVRPALERFYESLTDEQRARFNEIGPNIGRDEQRTAQNAPQQGDCGGAKSGLSALAIDRIEDVVQPNEAQLKALDRLSGALDKAVETLQAACPTTVAMTPVGRLEVMQQRLEAMIEASNIVRPALEDFYASLSNEQKAKFNRLSRQTAQAN